MQHVSNAHLVSIKYMSINKARNMYNMIQFQKHPYFNKPSAISTIPYLTCDFRVYLFKI